MNLLELLPFAALAWIGTLHCAGMCGPLAVAVALETPQRRSATFAAYTVGKAAMYAVLALLTAATLERAGQAGPHWLSHSRAAAAWLAGLVMIAAGLAQGGWLRANSHRWLAPVERAVRLAWRGAGELPGVARGFAMGAANGLLPCGLSWSAIALAAASSPPATVLGPLVFGVATAPGLASLVLLGARVPARWRERVRRVAAAALCVYGAWTVARGSLAFAPRAADAVLPDCCARADE